MDIPTPNFPRRQRRLWTLLGALVLVASGTQARDKASEALMLKAPPQPVEARVSVHRGESVEIPFKIYGSRGQSLVFLIRSLPKAGKLSELKRTGQETAVVAYTPPSDFSVRKEKFSYAVRGVEGVSASVDVLITILDEPPELGTPGSLEFERPILPGEKSTQSLQIVNHGGSFAEGQIEIDAPWQIDGPQTYRLAAGETRQLKITFAPGRAGSYRGQVRFSTEKDSRITTLSAEALPPISLGVEKMTLSAPGGEGERTGEFSVINNTPTEQSISFEADGRLFFERVIKLAPHQKEKVAVSTAASDTLALHAEIRLKAPESGPRIAVQAEALGPIVRVERTRLHFGTLKIGETQSQSVEIKNEGGTATTVSLQVADPFSLNEKSVVLAPGDRKTVSVTFAAAQAGAFHAELQIQSHPQNQGSPTPSVSLDAQAVAPPSAAEIAYAETLKTRPAPAHPKAADPSQSVQATGRYPAKITALKSSSVGVTWSELPPGAGSYTAQTRQLSLFNKELKVDWEDFATFSAAPQDDHMAGTFSGLQPGTPYAMRVSTPANAGSAPRVCFEVQFNTPKASESGIETPGWGKMLGAALAVVLGTMGWQKWRRSRVE